MTNNICKFVTTTSEKQIFTTNFVLEHNPELLKHIEDSQYYSIRIVLNGTGTLHSDYFTGNINPGSIFFTFPNIACGIKTSRDFKCMYISFHGLRTQELFQRFRISQSNCLFEGHDGLLAFWQNCLGKANENNLDLISESVLLYTLAQLTPAAINGKQRLIDDILKYIENSFTNYVKNTRIQYAIFLIEHGITTVKNLALLCGFTDPYYFSNVFKEVVGVYPSKYIDNLMKDSPEESL